MVLLKQILVVLVLIYLNACGGGIEIGNPNLTSDKSPDNSVQPADPAFLNLMPDYQLVEYKIPGLVEDARGFFALEEGDHFQFKVALTNIGGTDSENPGWAIYHLQNLTSGGSIGGHGEFMTDSGTTLHYTLFDSSGPLSSGAYAFQYCLYDHKSDYDSAIREGPSPEAKACFEGEFMVLAASQ